jgi:hypothetical protein
MSTLIRLLLALGADLPIILQIVQLLERLLPNATLGALDKQATGTTLQKNG